jgi:phosphoglycerate dehydrogenase-like enzyme
VSESRPTAVVLGASAAGPPPGIEAAGGIVDLRFAPGADALLAVAPETDAVFSWHGDREALQAAWPRLERLRWIQTASAGVDGLLFPELAASRVAVTNARGVFEDPIAEWVIGMLLGFATDVLTTSARQREVRWDSRVTHRFAGSRVAVVGPGPIGRAVAVRARALGAEVRLVGRTARLDPELGEVAGIDRLHEVLAAADHVVDALPLTPATRRLFDEAAFAAMPPTTTFVNVGRGETVDEAALIVALQDGELAAAALDVFEQEPLPASSLLWSMPNVVVSPHMCGDVAGWEDAVVALFVDNAGRFVRGEPLRNPVDTGLGFGVG